MSNHRRFYLERVVDVTGISGTGRVADGVLWQDNSADIRWRGLHGSTVHWDKFESVLVINGHEGKTRVVWIDQANPGPDYWMDE